MAENTDSTDERDLAPDAPEGEAAQAGTPAGEEQAAREPLFLGGDESDEEPDAAAASGAHPGPAMVPAENPAPATAPADQTGPAQQAAPEGEEAAEASSVAAASAATDESVRAERDRLAAERAARREARRAALAPAPVPDPALAAAATAEPATAAAQTAPPERITVTRRTTDRFAGSLALFLLRLVVALIFGLRGVDTLLDLPGTVELLQGTILPEPAILAVVLGAAEVAIAIALVFGLLTRVAGLGVALVAGGALAFVLWGPWSPFIPSQDGFIGELELLLVAVGLVFLLVGAGGWSVDRGIRAGRSSDKRARAEKA